jgi:hypothetical protein
VRCTNPGATEIDAFDWEAVDAGGPGGRCADENGEDEV